MNNKNAVERIEYELTTFIRRAVYIDNSENKIGNLERASYLILRQLEEFGPARVKELAASFKLDISTLSRQTGTLEGKGLIERSSDPSDGRVSLFTITELGREKLKADKKMRLARYQNMLETWSSKEKELFGELLERMNEAFFD
ncbi:MarR family winged helix-turn-helix transcriptional regulator [Fictibacillus fluitans]|uniref:MarR family transcriptional regulator n=1 Tax=Fictibacillus fluitans TaxID=3058422 RepID=A0ABT8I3R8_9BACL|nr:MarR family transcriptional regulator [Fictibacillus sp. NE201]MDN4527147.1 MarR family transcriptional regulator [Fictibacillus sp. NE201]